MTKNKTPRNDKGQRHGLWERYYNDDKWYKCFFHNNKQVGYAERLEGDWKITEKIYHL